MLKVFVVCNSALGYDDGIAGIFSTHEKALAYVRSHRHTLFSRNANDEAFIEEFPLDAEALPLSDI